MSNKKTPAIKITKKVPANATKVHQTESKISSDDCYIRSRLIPTLAQLMVEPKPVRALPRSISKTTGVYKGDDLKAYEGRPGSMDAFKLPSLVDGKRIKAKKPAIIMANPVGLARND